MLYKIIGAALLFSSSEALNVQPKGISRREAFAKGAALSALMPLAAFAELKKATDAEIYERVRCHNPKPCPLLSIAPD
jgi:hypothetical protein